MKQQRAPEPPPTLKEAAPGLAMIAFLLLLVVGGCNAVFSDDEQDTTPTGVSSSLTVPANPVPAAVTPAPAQPGTGSGSSGSDDANGGGGFGTAMAAVGVAAGFGTVTHIVDGDTVDVAGSTGTVRIRVLGIDSPEVHGGVECGGPDASAFATRTLLNKTVELRSDPTQAQTDAYGRSLRYVFQAGVHYSEAIADHGFAESYVYGGVPVQAHAQILAAENRAKAARRGIWGGVVSCQSAQQPAQQAAPQSAPQPQRPFQQPQQQVAPRPVPAPKPPSAPKPQPAAGGSAYYKNCSAARAAGAAPVRRGQPGYGGHLDRDGDGIGCE